MRTLSGMMLAALIGLTTGCGKSDSPATPTAPTADPNKPEPAPPKDDPKKAGSTPGANPAPPAPPTAGWEMDPAKHVLSTTPVAGKVGGEAFTPEASLFDRTLALRVQKPVVMHRAVEIALSPEQLAAGGKIVVRPDQKEGPDVPQVSIETPGPAGAAPAVTVYPNGYALTLELKKDHNQYTGRLCLALPDKEKSYLCGGFAATRVRAADTPPGPDDVPFVQGKVTVAGASRPVVQVGYVGVEADGKFPLVVIDLPFSMTGRFSFADLGGGRVSSLATPTEAAPYGRYEHSRLPPARYLVFARVADGPAVWRWLTVGPDTRSEADFTLDPTKAGGLEVRVPADTIAKVHLAPADDPARPIDTKLFLAIALSLGLGAEQKGGTAKFENLGPGVYEVRAGDLTGTAEVKAGQTAKVELKKK